MVSANDGLRDMLETSTANVIHAPPGQAYAPPPPKYNRKNSRHGKWPFCDRSTCPARAVVEQTGFDDPCDSFPSHRLVGYRRALGLVTSLETSAMPGLNLRRHSARETNDGVLGGSEQYKWPSHGRNSSGCFPTIKLSNVFVGMSSSDASLENIERIFLHSLWVFIYCF